MPVAKQATEWRDRVIKLHAKSYDHRPEVLASVRGALAVHPTLLRPGVGGAPVYSETAWTVTHMGTKLALHTNLRKEDAFALATEMLGCNWDFNAEHRMPAETKAATKAACEKYSKTRMVAA